MKVILMRQVSDFQVLSITCSDTLSLALATPAAQTRKKIMKMRKNGPGQRGRQDQKDVAL
jgi:hypothetical protein